MGEEQKQVSEAEAVEPKKHWRDELNLAEFPLSSIAERVDKDQKTLVFTDTTWDPSRRETITRQLTITASDQYGLPTALDDEVILGLVNLSKLSNFESRHVPFTRYELLRLLGWSDDSKSYRRLELSLMRWTGITLHYKNAWWDKEQQSWVDEHFHILDNVTLYDREKMARRRQTQGSLPLSSFAWNDVVFRSFSNGNLKSLDFDLYKSLESSIAKRLYRFLDKRFYLRPRWEFDLMEVSWEHVGLSRNYDAANLKRKLLPAIDELQSVGFLTAMAPEQRFVKLKSGKWSVFFEKQSRKREAGRGQRSAVNQTLVDVLVARGVTPSTAEVTVENFNAEKIQTQVEAFDWMMAKPDGKRPKNPPGYLVESIKGEYAAPTNFVSKADTAKREADAAERKRKAEEKAKAEREREATKVQAKDAAIRDFWAKHSDGERARMELEALEEASEVELRVINGKSGMAKTIRKHVMDRFAIKVMSMAA